MLKRCLIRINESHPVSGLGGYPLSSSQDSDPCKCKNKLRRGQLKLF